MFPLAEILKRVLRIAQREMGRAIEIEFAVNLDYTGAGQHTFYLLQIRPIVDTKEVITEDIGAIPEDDAIITCRSALGHGITTDIADLVYVKPDAFSASKNQLIMYDIERLNRRLVDEGRHYVLVGPGRWGSSDPWLGIPVKWPHISNARVIVESGLANYRIDPSQGTHFFQNLGGNVMSYHGYTVDTAFLDAQPAAYESEYVRHVRFARPMTIKVDGRKNLGVVLKPEGMS